MPACIVRRGGKVIDACIAPTPDAALVRALRPFGLEAWPDRALGSFDRGLVARLGLRPIALVEIRRA